MRSWNSPFVALLGLAGFLPAQDVPPGIDLGQVVDQAAQKKVLVEAKFVSGPARPGEVATLELRALIEPGWHIYGRKDQSGQPTTVTLTEKNGLEPFGEAKIPDGAPHEQFGATSHWLEGEAKITQQISVPAGLQPGEVLLQGAVEYVACTEKTCIPPERASWSAKLVIEEGERRPTRVAKKVEIEARFERPTARAGERAVLVLQTRIATPWHIYGRKETVGDPSRIQITESGGLTAGKAVIPDGEPHDIGLDEPSYWLKGEVTLRQHFTVPANAEPGEVEVRGKLLYMPCTEDICDDSTEVGFAAKLTIEEGEARKGALPGAGKEADAGPQAAAGGLMREGIWGFILLAIAGGLFALVMPCTYPMIPITVSFFTKQADSREGKVLPLSLVYGAGIVLIFVLIGVIIGPTIVGFATHPITNLVIGTLFLAFALVLFGVFTLNPPRFLMNFASKASMRGGYAGVFLMGATLVVTSFTCTAPFVGSLLGAGAKLGTAAIALGMGVFGLTMAVPFVFLSLVPGKIQSLPQSGQWMNTFKVFLGFVEVAAALKFISNADVVWQWQALPRELFLYLWAGIFVVAGLFLLGMFRIKGETGEIGPGRLVGALCVLLFASYNLYGANGNRLDNVMTAIAPNYSNRLYETTGETHTIVKDDYERARQVALKSDKKLLINFTGFS